MGVMHEADDAYSIHSTWSCYWLDQFLTLAPSMLILSIFYISMDLSTNYFAHFSGCHIKMHDSYKKCYTNTFQTVKTICRIQNPSVKKEDWAIL